MCRSGEWTCSRLKQHTILSNALSLLAAEGNALFRTFTLASISGVFSLFPLLFTPAGEVSFHCVVPMFPNMFAETFIKIIYSLVWAYLTIEPLSKRVYEYVTFIQCSQNVAHAFPVDSLHRYPGSSSTRSSERTSQALPSSKPS